MSCCCPKYKVISLFKGDDTDFNGLQFLTFNFKVKEGSSFSFEGFTARFEIGDYSFTDDISDGEFVVSLSREITENLDIGKYNGVLTIIDPDGKEKTIENEFPFFVTNEVFEPQNEEFQVNIIDTEIKELVEVDVVLGQTGNYVNLSNLPSLNGHTIIGDKTSADYGIPSQTEIAELEQELKDLIGNEQTQREQADSDLQADIDGKYEELTRNIDDLADVVEEDFTKVNTRITEVASELEQSIEENVVALQNEDTALQNQINNHSQTLTSYDTRIANNASSISQEVYDRQSADDHLQEQIDGITASSDVKDIVGTYEELQAYDKSTLGNNDIIKVLQDETQENASTYYRYIATTQSFTYIGKEGPFYTKSEADTLLNAKQNTLISGTTIKTINNESLLGSGDIEIKASPDVDDLTISLNSENKIQSIGAILQSGGYQKYWEGTKAQFNAIPVKDSNTLYQVLDDVEDITTEIPTATLSDIGLVKPDGLTITIDDTGTISTTNLAKDDLTNVRGAYDWVITSVVYGGGESGYRKWRNGYMEQWGKATSANGEVEFNLHQPYKDTNFSIFGQVAELGNYFVSIYPSGNQKFKLRVQSASGANMSVRFMWHSYGFYK